MPWNSFKNRHFPREIYRLQKLQADLPNPVERQQRIPETPNTDGPSLIDETDISQPIHREREREAVNLNDNLYKQVQNSWAERKKDKKPPKQYKRRFLTKAKESKKKQMVLRKHQPFSNTEKAQKSEELTRPNATCRGKQERISKLYMPLCSCPLELNQSCRTHTHQPNTSRRTL